MKHPHEVKLSQEEGDALIERLECNALSAADRYVLAQVVRLYFWLLFMLQESKLSLKRLRAMLFGRRSKKRTNKTSSREASEIDRSSGGDGATYSEMVETLDQVDAIDSRQPSEAQRRGHGRQGAAAYGGAQRVACRHETLGVGDRCPACGFGRLYPLAPGVELRIDGNAILSAIRYELEKLRCSACGIVFTAKVPEAAGNEKYNARSRAVLALSRYFLGVPFYRLASYQAMLGVPIADATQWELVEQVADSAYPVFEHLAALAAQGEVIYQDDTHVRILSLMAENLKADSSGDETNERTGMHTTALVSKLGERTIYLYVSGRAHAGENLHALLAKRPAALDKPIVMSDALTANEADEDALIRSHCLAHARRKFTEIEEVFPESCGKVIGDLNQVFKHDETARAWHLGAGARLAYHQQHSAPVMKAIKAWMENQFEACEVEPNSSLGKAYRYVLGHWETLTRFLQVAGAPIDNNTAERALKLAIRQRKNSLFYASEHSAYVASLLSSLIATCAEAGVNALNYLVALQENRTAVFRQPQAWLPWNYPMQPLAP